jgi:hypothetical protein
MTGRHEGTTLFLPLRYCHHGLITNIECYEDGVRYMTKGYNIYEEFYSKTVAEFLAPAIIMGKGDEIAHALGELAHTLKPLLSLPIFGGNHNDIDTGVTLDSETKTPVVKSEVALSFCELFGHQSSLLTCSCIDSCFI